MSIPDPVTTGVVLAGALQIAKQGQEFIAAATGHPGESIGTILGSIGRRRVQNLEAIGNKAHLTLLNIGVEPQEVPLDTIQPLVDGASVQENPSMQDMWANLLANATDPRRLTTVQPSIPYLLRLLTPHEAKFLKAVYLDVEKRAVMIGAEAIVLPRDLSFSRHRLFLIYAEFGMASYEGIVREVPWENVSRNQEAMEADERAFALTLETLCRHGVMREEQRTEFNGGSSYEEPGISTDKVYFLSRFGWMFVKACQPPTVTP